MARVKRGSNRRERRKKVLAQSSGYYGNKGNAYRIAKQAVDKSGVNPTAIAGSRSVTSARCGSSASTPGRACTASPTAG